MWTFRHQKDGRHVAMQGARFFAVSLIAAVAGLRAARGVRARRIPEDPGRDAGRRPGRADLVSRQQALVVPLAAHEGSSHAGRRPGRAARLRRSARRGARRRLIAARRSQIVKQQPAARTLLLTHSGRALQRSGARASDWLVIVRQAFPRTPLASWLVDRTTGAISGHSPTAEHPPPRGHRGDPHRAARRQGRRLGAALQGAHPVRELRPDVPHLDGARERRPALRRDRAGRGRRPHRQGAARVDGAAGELDDGARLQGVVRAEAQRHASLARLLRGLPDRARRLAPHLDAAHARPRRPALLLDLALVLRARPRVLGRAAAVPADGLPDRAPDLDRRARRGRGRPARDGCRPGRWRLWRSS